MKRHSLAGVVLIILSIALLAGCDDNGYGGDGSGGNGGNGDGGGAQPMPDLAISAIEVFPAQPTAGQRFTLNVYVTNRGDADSAPYELAISIRDVSRGSTYPVGTFSQSSLRPGENIPAYADQNRLVNDAGSFQVQVEIIPSGADGNTGNNATNWAFTVAQ
jgi:hypothetical protein